MQIGVGRGTYSRRVAQAYPLPGYIQVETQQMVVGGGVSRKSDRTTSGPRSQGFNLQPVLIENQGAVNFTQAAGQIGVSNSPVRDLHTTLHDGSSEAAVNRHIHRDHAG